MSTAKLKVVFGVEGSDVPMISLIPCTATFHEVLHVAERRTGISNLRYVWADGSRVDNDDKVESLYDSGSMLLVTSSNKKPDDLLTSLELTRSNKFITSLTEPLKKKGIDAKSAVSGKPKSSYIPPVARPTQPPEIITIPHKTTVKSDEELRTNAASRPVETPAPSTKVPDTTGQVKVLRLEKPENKTNEVEKSVIGITKEGLGMKISSLQSDAPTEDGRFVVRTTASYESMVTGVEMDIPMTTTFENVKMMIRDHILTIWNPTFPIDVRLYFAGGIPFNSGAIGSFFTMENTKLSKHIIYAVASRQIPEKILNEEILELCDCSSPQRKNLLAPMSDATEIGYTHMACLLGYLNHFGARGDQFMTLVAKFTGFAPLINGVYRLVEHINVTGRVVVDVTASLFAYCQYLLPCSDDKVLDYLLRTICWAVHGLGENEMAPPIRTYEWNMNSSDAFDIYCLKTKQPSTIVLYLPDSIENYARSKHEKPDDPGKIENAFVSMVSFKPVAPLGLRVVTGCTIVKGLHGNTLLFLSQSHSKDAKAAEMVDIIDSLTGLSSSENLEQLAKRVGLSGEGSTQQLVEKKNIMQLINVCYDASKSMRKRLNGHKVRSNAYSPGIEPDKVPETRQLIAQQYLTSFANRTYGYRVPSLQGLISFNSEVKVESPLSPLVPDFENGVVGINTSKGTRLWDAINAAADSLLAEYYVEKKVKRYPNAEMRIVVISDGNDRDSTITPWDLAKKCLDEKIVVDAVIVTTKDLCKTLGVFCHMTGGVAFRPPDVSTGLRIFEQEAFLNIKARIQPRRYRDKFTQEKMNELEKTLEFDTTTNNSVLKAADSHTLQTLPKIISLNDKPISIARNRRILQEIRAAASVQQPGAQAKNENDELVDIYDPDIAIYINRGHMDQWRVYLKGIDGTPYAGKWWSLFVVFPSDYPVRPPEIRFVSVPYHLNVSDEGRICLDMIERGYMQNTVVVEMLQKIRSLFLIPDESAPIQIEKLWTYQNNRDEYYRLARKSAETAEDSVEAWLKNSMVDGDVDANFTLEITKSAIPDYMRSQISGKYVPKDRRVVTPDGVICDRDEYSQLMASCAGKPMTGGQALGSLGDDDML